jgi:hypothetical protein
MVARPALSLLRTSGLERRPSPKCGPASGELRVPGAGKSSYVPAASRQQRLRQLRHRRFPAHAIEHPMSAGLATLMP